MKDILEAIGMGILSFCVFAVAAVYFAVYIGLMLVLLVGPFALVVFGVLRLVGAV